MRAWVVALGVVPLCAACGAQLEGGVDDVPSAAAPVEVPAPEGSGTTTVFGNLSLRDVFIPGPPTGRYEAGQNAVVRLTIVNGGRSADAVVAVRSAMAEEMRIRWDRECDGAAEPVDRLPVPGRSGLFAPPDARKFPRRPYYLQIIGFTRAVPAGATVPVTVTFQHAGTVTVPAKVEAGQATGSPSLPCAS